MIVVEHEELERIVGQQLPKSGSPNLMDTSVVLVVSLLLIGSSALT
jgi:hypothetical protein